MRKKGLVVGMAFLLACPLVLGFHEEDEVIHEYYEDRLGIVHRAAICLPPEFNESQKYPAIVICGGWTNSLEETLSIARHVAEWGYIAMVVEPTAKNTCVASMLLGGLPP
mgnify:CR=1 FL=1